MTPLEALKVLEQVTGQINTSREGHAKIYEAITTINKFITESNKETLNGKNT